MRKFFLSIFTALLAIGFVGCEYDDSALWGEVNSLKDRVLTLEQLCQQMNTNISSLQSLVSALQNQDYITSVTPIKQGNDVIGYTITFAKGEPFTIYHGQNGKDGQNGQNGADGKDGYTPVIGVDKADDGKYYWTLDGEWLTDKEGNKIPATGKDGKDGADGKDGQDGKDGEDGKDGADGKDGQDGKDGEDGDDAAAVMPELKIQGGYWYISYDGGENWERLGRATGYDGTDGKDGQNGQDGDSFFQDINIEDDYIEFILDDGTSIVIPVKTNTNNNSTITSDEALEDVLTSNSDVINITLGADVTIDINAWSHLPFGGPDTKIIIINGQNHTLTFNQLNSDWANVISSGKLVLNNLNIAKSGYGTDGGAWNTHVIMFNCEVEMNNVTSSQALGVRKNATLKNVEITEDEEFYGLWIPAEGQTVDVDGLKITATNKGRGIKIADEYITSPAKVTLNVKNSSFTTAKKAAVLVTSTAGADINWGTGNNISGVAADKVFAVWVDEDRKAYADKVKVTGARCRVEDDAVVTTLAELQSALDGAKNGAVIYIEGDITGDVTATQKENVKITILGQNHSFKGAITINGKSARYATAGLTIQNVNFTSDDSITAAANINLGKSGDNNTRYTSNVTVKDCTFSTTATKDVVAVKSYTGGDHNLSIIGCTVNAGMHSLAQVTNVEKGLKFEGCKAYSKNGINLNNTPTFDMDGCTFDTKGYAVRVGVSGNANTETKTFNISNSTLKSACDDGDAVIIFRSSATYATLNLTNTTLIGTTTISGVTAQTTVNNM